MDVTVFHDRADAGRQLAERLHEYAGQDCVVYALPRGGVILGAIIAKALHAPYDVVITRKIGHPINPEYAVCAISETGDLVCNEVERALLNPEWLRHAIEREKTEASRRRELYLAGRTHLSAQGKIAIIVDDGIATGLTMRAAIKEIARQHPLEIVVAVPVIPKETAELLQREDATLVAVSIPDEFLGAVGAYYDDFRQVTDAEVIAVLHEDPTWLLAFPMYATMAQLLSSLIPLAPWHAGRYANGELFVTLSDDVGNARCVVIGSLMPPDEHLLTTLLLCHTLKTQGAIHVTAVLPYLSYMRQEKFEARHSRATPWSGALMRASGIDEIITVDAHSQQAVDALHLPVHECNPAPLFAQVIHDNGWDDATLVAPDAGALRRCQDVQTTGHFAAPPAHCEKVRTADGVHSTLHGAVGTRAVVIDDILDTGGTLVACCEGLQRTGVKAIMVMVTHALFTGTTWQQLWNMGVQAIYCTDTVPFTNIHDERIRVISILPLLEQALRETNDIQEV